MSKPVDVPITFEKGLILSSEASVLEEGALSELTNWTPEPTGGLRVRQAWEAASATGDLADYTPWTNRGIGVLSTQRLPRVVQGGVMDFEAGRPSGSNIVLSLPYATTPGNVLIVVIETAHTTSYPTITGRPAGFVTRTARVLPNDSGYYVKVWSEIKPVTVSEPSGTAYTWTLSNIGGYEYGKAWLLEVENVDADLAPVQAYADSATNPVSCTAVVTAGSTFALVFGHNQTGARKVGLAVGGMAPTYLDETVTSTWSITTVGWQALAGAGSKTLTGTVASYPADDVDVYMIAYHGAGYDQFTQNVLVAEPADDVAYDPGVWNYTAGSYYVTAADATTYTTASISIADTERILVVGVANRKTATAPDEVSAWVGTDGLNTTWTAGPTYQSGDFRISTAFVRPVSTTSGTLTVQFGGNTQLACSIIWGWIHPDDSNDLEGLDFGDNTATATGTGMTVTTTFTERDPQSIGFMFVVDTNSGGGPYHTFASPLTEMSDFGDSEGMMCAMAYDLISTPPTTSYQDTLNSSHSYKALSWEIAIGGNTTGLRAFALPTNDLESGDWASTMYAFKVQTSAMSKFAEGSGTVLWSGTGMNQAVLYDKATSAQSYITAIQPGRAVEYHKNRFFVAGAAATPSRLWFSDLGAGGSYPGSSYIDVSADDGDAIEDLISVENVLLICKTNSFWILSGSGVESFFLSELSGGSAAPGKAAVVTPYGTVVAGRYTVWSVQGGAVDPISRPIASQYQITGNVSTAYHQDKVYILDDADGTIWVNNLFTGAWHKEQLSSADDRPKMIRDISEQLFFGTVNSAVTPLGYRARGVPAREPDFSPHTTAYSMASPVLFLAGPSFKYTPRHLMLQVRRHGNPSPLFVTVTVPDGATTESRTWEITTGAPVSRERLDVGFAQGKAWIQVSAALSIDAGGAGMELERCVLQADVEQVR